MSDVSEDEAAPDLETETPELPTPPAPEVLLTVELDRRINYALQQNRVPVVKRVSIEHRGESILEELVLVVRCEPEFAPEWTLPIDRIAPDSVHLVDNPELELSPAFLEAVRERVAGTMHFEVRRGEEVLGARTEAIELLAREEWSGLGSLPEILAAFVLPNHPVVEELLGAAAARLERWSGDPSLNGYQTHDPARVASMAAAVYAAMVERDLSYANPPASFESLGQKVRLPGRVAETGLATCLDAALLAAACLEQSGLHPLLLLTRGHAFTGVWLDEQTFPEPATDDGARIKKRVDLGELLVFDPTLVTRKPTPDFEGAVAEARRQLDRLEEFSCAIDIARARKGGLRPLPERVPLESGEHEGDEAPEERPGSSFAPDLARLGIAARAPLTPAVEPSRGASRLDRWRRKLLDLTRRNRLLNFRETNSTVPLLCPDLAALEDVLSGGSSFQVRPRPDELESSDPRAQRDEEAIDELLRGELSARRLCADLSKAKLERRLLEIYRQARREREEGGVSALYLALGFLEWYENGSSRRTCRAPILLLPLELSRRTVRSGFSLRLADEDPMVNVTLLEMLRTDHGLVIPGLNPLPGDDSGVDVDEVLRIFRHTVRDIDRWNVTETSAVGFFSFSKFLMWTDLSERADSLLENDLVAHLVERPGEDFEADGEFPAPETLDERYPPAATSCPLPVDSSQLSAIHAAAAGRSFVLEGPPGTGKSQTITNLIAHCLGQGKTVLFVSEKMAALEVVRTRLESIGLGPFCLELHSNKARKRHVVEQLGAALDLVAHADEDEWRAVGERLEGLRGELNGYVSALHAPRETGESLYQGISRSIGLRSTPRLDLELPRDLDAAGLATARERLDALIIADELSEEVATHPFRAARRREFSPLWREEVERALGPLIDTTGALDERLQTVAGHLGVPAEAASLETLGLLVEAAGRLIDAPAPPEELLKRSDWESLREQVEEWIASGRRRLRLREQILARFEETIFELDLEELRVTLERAARSWWPKSWFLYRGIGAALAGAARDGARPGTEELAGILDPALAVREEERRLEAVNETARALLGRAWRGVETDWPSLEAILEWAGVLRRVATRLAGTDYEHAVALRQTWARLALEAGAELRADGPLGRELDALREAHSSWRERREALETLLELDPAGAWGTSPREPGILERVARTARRMLDTTPRLREWCAWQRKRAEAVEVGLTPLIDELEAGRLAAAELRCVFDRAWYQRWSLEGVEAEEVLRNFFRPEHERRIDEFKSADEAYARRTRDLLVARLAERVPHPASKILPTSEPGILRREMQKKRRHKSVRTLFREIPNLLPRIKPCLLMSPLSVAQYLDPDHAPFDIVVFDEASQIPVWDGIGAIARGSQAVIVGDPKQLPPTTFFQRTESEDEFDAAPVEEEEVEDLESILDDCLASGIARLSLDWHYRSRHESLIAFSNHNYYDGRLLTFPSPDRDGLGVRWREVPDGIYDKGKTRTNRREAECIVEEIVRRLLDPELSRFTIGVVTFNLAQQVLIEDLLEERRREDPRIDAFFAEDTTEGVFVKNLENVQGDERDVILFSITYGPDEAGKVSMNFGPMNRDGGERRLNVAITRARREVIVFSTLRAEQIDLVRTQARGVADLRAFLEYAQHGPLAIARQNRFRPADGEEAPFEEAIAAALRARGWTVETRVGCSGYRLDLAVIDHDYPSRYLLGIECDGRGYAAAKTARDRDKLRAEVLGHLGWRVHRVWSSDWWYEPEEELSRIEAALEAARNGTSEEELEEASEGEEEAEVTLDDSGEAPALSRPRRPRTRKLEIYKPTPTTSLKGDADHFFEEKSSRAVRAALERVVRREGPISVDLAARRVASMWGMDRMRARTLDRVRELLEGPLTPRDSGGHGFLWPEELDPETWSDFRTAGDDPASERAPDDLPLEEIRNAGHYLLRSHLSLPVEDLARETARLFGFARLGSALRERMMAGLQLLFDQELAEREGDAIVIRSKR